jgi:hypothetical protein
MSAARCRMVGTLSKQPSTVLSLLQKSQSLTFAGITYTALHIHQGFFALLGDNGFPVVTRVLGASVGAARLACRNGEHHPVQWIGGGGYVITKDHATNDDVKRYVADVNVPIVAQNLLPLGGNMTETARRIRLPEHGIITDDNSSGSTHFIRNVTLLYTINSNNDMGITKTSTHWLDAIYTSECVSGVLCRNAAHSLMPNSVTKILRHLGLSTYIVLSVCPKHNVLGVTALGVCPSLL